MKLKINGEYVEVGFFSFFKFYLVSWLLFSLILGIWTIVMLGVLIAYG